MLTKYIFLILRIFLDAFRHTKKIIKHLKMLQFNNVTIILKIFFINVIYIFPKFRALKKGNEAKIDAAQISSKPDVKIIVSELNAYGCSSTFTFNDEILKNAVDEVFKYNKNNIILRREKKDISEIIKQDNESVEEYLKRLTKNKISKFIIPIDLQKSPSIKKLVLSDLFLEIAQKYLNSKNFSVSTSCQISNPVSTDVSEKIGNAQYFHFDNDFSKFLKLYIYLVDVDDENGPHIYVEGSHKYKKLKHLLMRPIPPDEIKDNYKKTRKYIGKKGSYFLEDGFGIHKGESPDKRSRIILNIHYGYEKIKYYKDDIYFEVAKASS